MIQRIQSIYLLCSVIFMAIFVFTPYFNITTPDAVYQLSSCGISISEMPEASTTTPVIASSQNYVVAIISALIMVLSVIAIFMYKNRNKQMLVCKINYIFYITLYVVMALYAYTHYSALGGTAFATTSFVVFPVCAVITNWLAVSAINKDEQMVRDSERMWTRNR